MGIRACGANVENQHLLHSNVGSRLGLCFDLLLGLMAGAGASVYVFVPDVAFALMNVFHDTLSGQFHRLLTSSFLHFDWKHALVDWGGIVFARRLFWPTGRVWWHWSAYFTLHVLTGTVAAIAAVTWWPEKHALIGSSDYLFFLLGIGSCRLAVAKPRIGWLGAVCLVLYLGVDLWLGHPPFWPEAPSFGVSHCTGALLGVLAWLGIRGIRHAG